MSLIRSIQHWNRARQFGAQRKVLFLMQLSDYVESNLPLDAVLGDFQDDESDPVTAEVAALMKQSLIEYSNPSAKARAYGYFTMREHALLTIGYDQKSLPVMANVIVRDIEVEEQSIAAMIIANAENVLGVVMGLLVAVELTPMASIYTNDPMLFKISGFFTDYWRHCLVGIAVMLMIYTRLKKETTGTTRDVLRRMGCFYLSDRLDERRFLAISEGLCRARIPIEEFYRVAQKVMADRTYFVDLLVKASNRIADENLIKTLRYVVSPHSYRAIKAKSRANASMTDIAEGFELAKNNNEKRLARSYFRVSKSIEIAVAVAFLSIMLALLPVLFGEGIIPN